MKRSISTTCTSVRSAIMGRGSTISVSASTVSPFPSTLWALKAAKAGGTSFFVSSLR